MVHRVAIGIVARIAVCVVGAISAGLVGLAAFPPQIQSSVAPGERYFRVTASSLRLREEPDINSRAIGLILRNRLVVRTSGAAYPATIHKQSGYWIPVTTLQDQSGYVFDALLQAATPRAYLFRQPYAENKANGPCQPSFTISCLSQLAARQVRAAPELRRLRANRGYRLKAFNGEEMEFRNVLTQSDTRVRYFPLGRLAKNDRFFTFLLLHWEGSNVMLVDRLTRSKLYLWNYPLQSPDGQHLFVLSASEAHNSNGFQLVRLSEAAPRLLQESHTGWFGGLARWTGPRSIQLQRWFPEYDLDNQEPNVFYSELELRMEGERLRVID